MTAEAHLPGDEAASSVAARVQSVLDAVEREAASLRREVEHEAERQAQEILAVAERDAKRVLEAADELARAHHEDARRRLDAHTAERIQRIHDVTDRLLAVAEDLAGRFEDAARVRDSLVGLMNALGVAAEEASAQAAAPLPPVSPPHPFPH